MFAKSVHGPNKDGHSPTIAFAIRLLFHSPTAAPSGTNKQFNLGTRGCMDFKTKFDHGHPLNPI